MNTQQGPPSRAVRLIVSLSIIVVVSAKLVWTMPLVMVTRWQLRLAQRRLHKLGVPTEPSMPRRPISPDERLQAVSEIMPWVIGLWMAVAAVVVRLVIWMVMNGWT